MNCFRTLVIVNSNINLYSLSQKLLAWGVHVLTSTGLVTAFMAIISIEKEDWRACFLWLFLCFLIDGIDGTLARKFKVDKVLPNMDGKLIDFVVDFVAYLIVPTFFFYKAGMAPPNLMIPSLIVILISSALYYGKKNMVEDDLFFVGFPVLWNVVVFFLFFIFQNNLMLNFGSVVFFGIMHFIPVRFAYVTRTKKYFKMHILFSAIGLIGAIIVLYLFPQRSFPAEIATLVAVSYFSLFAIYDTVREPQV